ncbi:uncharacterized protein [Prorops nasuta]|uniref:uncharacterized protein n=1 Tax=Prorops nasuta TaxID=863751 RepID=UPI0034CF506E
MNYQIRPVLLYLVVLLPLLWSVTSKAEVILCECKDYCEGEKRVIGLEEGKSSVTYTSQEDPAKSPICARDRDSGDKTFRNECHMNCYNRCSHYRLSKIAVKEEEKGGEKGTSKKPIVQLYRSNYYKLRDGSCE